ncbi:MAG: hypothetical protein QNJ12_07075 [Ilumatobacter sp.]|uniref:hypothetical protein n=1 Tax=Ilumatobacter sp. TaxID=1967498 RepID=UPI0026045663|nr:hypothetical protein [Ilumatobacter sp.]MDJ0768539.1 hypothetical protein [Ilumatobacter sp.]
MAPVLMWDRKAGKVSNPFLFNIGLLCSKTCRARCSLGCALASPPRRARMAEA